MGNNLMGGLRPPKFREGDRVRLKKAIVNQDLSLYDTGGTSDSTSHYTIPAGSLGWIQRYMYELSAAERTVTYELSWDKGSGWDHTEAREDELELMERVCNRSKDIGVNEVNRPSREDSASSASAESLAPAYGNHDDDDDDLKFRRIFADGTRTPSPQPACKRSRIN